MTRFKFSRTRDILCLSAALGISSILLVTSSGVGQETASENQKHTDSDSKSSRSDTSIVHQLHSLQSKVAKLEAVLKMNHQAPSASGQKTSRMGGMQSGSMPSMGMMNRGMAGKRMGMMGGMGSKESAQDAAGMRMSKAGMSGMGEMGKPKIDGMSMMGRMQGMGQMKMPSALPGFPGASHIYHVGSTDFFLDHPQHVTLSQEQQTKLNQIKQDTLLGQATFDRWADQAEQELWLLTSSDAPDATKIEKKVREIEKLSGNKRIAYIRAVGEAANVLTSEQRLSLVGMLGPDHSTTGSNSQR